MALLELPRIPVRLTRSDRAALAVSTAIAAFVAGRIERRRTRVERYLATAATRAVIDEARETGLRRGLALGIWR